jgi:ribonuclease P protein component
MDCVRRLRRRADIHKIFHEGRRAYSPWAVLHSRRRASGDDGVSGPRLAVIAGRRFRNAIVRNRARRLLREACRVALPGSAGPWDLILVARPEVLQSKHTERVAALSAALEEVGVIRRKTACAP